MSDELSSVLLSSFNKKFSDARTIWLAYSGGMDSHVLLHFLVDYLSSQDRISQLQVIHIDHGLSEYSSQWASHCELICAQLGVPCEVRSLAVGVGNANVEEEARNQRYEIFTSLLLEGDLLLMAHHQDDQLETMLYRLARGSGAKGLAGMPQSRPLGKGCLLRPLLSQPRSVLAAYAENNRLVYVEDGSNQDEHFDRNFLRHQVLPKLCSRWPAFLNNAQRSSELLREADQAQQVLGAQDLQKAISPLFSRLSVKVMKEFAPWRQRNMLRAWLQQAEEKYLIPPADFYSLHRIVDELIPAAIDAAPLVSWSDEKQVVEVRRYNDELYLMSPISVNLQETIPWDLRASPEELDLGPGLGVLKLHSVEKDGFDLSTLENLTISFRQKGHSFKPAGRPTRSFKKLCQDYKVPPWCRSYLPLVYSEGQLQSFADLFIPEQAIREDGENLYRIQWQKPEFHCGV